MEVKIIEMNMLKVTIKYIIMALFARPPLTGAAPVVLSVCNVRSTEFLTTDSWWRGTQYPGQNQLDGE